LSVEPLPAGQAWLSLENRVSASGCGKASRRGSPPPAPDVGSRSSNARGAPPRSVSQGQKRSSLPFLKFRLPRALPPKRKIQERPTRAAPYGQWIGSFELPTSSCGCRIAFQDASRNTAARSGWLEHQAPLGRARQERGRSAPHPIIMSNVVIRRKGMTRLAGGHVEDPRCLMPWSHDEPLRGSA
jgi:hypothetical protein